MTWVRMAFVYSGDRDGGGDGLDGVTSYELLTVICFHEKRASHAEGNLEVLLLQCSKLTLMYFLKF